MLTHTDSGPSTGATAIRVVESGSVDTYTSALRQALLASSPNELLVDAMERRLNVLAAKGKSGSSANGLISGVRLLEKLRIIKTVVTEVHWMQARAIGKGWARKAQPKTVTTWDHIEAITTSRGHWAWGRLVFLAICSIVYLWRVGDAASVTWEWISVPGFVTFWDEKRNKKVTTYALSPFLEAWRAYLWKHRPGHVQLRQPLVPGGRSVLQTVLQQVVQHRDLAKAAWHGLKKLGAVSWGHQGGKLRGLQVWGRWWTQAQPRHYWKTPPGWTLPAEIHVPWPVGDSGWLARDVEGRLVKPKSLWPTDAWLPEPKIPAAMFTRGDRDDPEPQGEDSDTSSACTSDEEPEAEGEETPTTEPVELLEKFDPVAQAEGKPQIPIGMDAEDGDTGVEPTSDSPAAAAGDSGPAEEHVVHVVVDDSDDAGDPINDLETSAAAPAAANDMDVRRKRQRDEDDLPDSAKRVCTRERGDGVDQPVREPESNTAPHFGYVVTAARRGPQYQLWRPVQVHHTGSHEVPGMRGPGDGSLDAGLQEGGGDGPGEGADGEGSAEGLHDDYYVPMERGGGASQPSPRSGHA